MPLSVTLHAVAFYGVAHVPWASPPVPHAAEKMSVVWLVDRSRATSPEPPLPDIFAPVPDASASPNPPEPAAIPRSADPRRAPPRPHSPDPRATPPQAETPQPAATPHAVPPNVDWEKERQTAARNVIEQQAQARRYPTFSLDKLVEKPKPAEPLEPATTALEHDDCVIVHNRAQRFAAQMMGRCVREARGDMFAAIMPEYLKVRAVCLETHPDAPGSVLADGTEISTVKCELVRRDAADPVPADIPTGTAQQARSDTP